MKRVTFKKEFKDIDDALSKIPSILKENRNVFELTDGNKNYRVRWEGTPDNGMAVPLIAVDKNLVNEDISHMKHLISYSSKSTLGVLNGRDRVNEETEFNNLLSLKKKH